MPIAMIETQETAGLRPKLWAEAKAVLFLFIYLALLLGAFVNYRRLILAEYQIAYFQYGYTLIEALLLAKLIVLGRYLHVGERFDRSPLIIPTLYKTFWFSLFILAFAVLEHLIIGRLHGKTPAVVFDEILAKTIWEILANVLVLCIALMPLFAAWSADTILGEGKLFQLFFARTARVNDENRRDS